MDRALIGTYFALDGVVRDDEGELLHRTVSASVRLGYWYTGLLSLLQGLFERAGKEASGSQEMHEKPYPMGNLVPGILLACAFHAAADMIRAWVA